MNHALKVHGMVYPIIIGTCSFHGTNLKFLTIIVLKDNYLDA